MFAVVLRTGVFRRPLQGIGSDPEGEASGGLVRKTAGGEGWAMKHKPELQHKSINRYLSIAGQSCLELV